MCWGILKHAFLSPIAEVEITLTNLRGGLSANPFNRISNPAVNDWPLVVTATEIEKVRLVCL